MKKTPTRHSINARDAEDMTRILLNDEITKLRDECEKKFPELKAENVLDWKKFEATMLPGIKIIKKLGIFINIGREDGKGLDWGRISLTEKGHYTAIEINATRAEKETFNKALKAIEKREAEREIYAKKIRELKSKKDDYKDLAARFRLGFTGDPADRDEVQNSCRAFLLNKEK